MAALINFLDFAELGITKKRSQFTCFPHSSSRISPSRGMMTFRKRWGKCLRRRPKPGVEGKSETVVYTI